jgi:hypothetical protein
MTPVAVQIEVRQGPAEPSQLVAWRQLWALLLEGNPEHRNASEVATPEAPESCAADQAARDDGSPTYASASPAI